MRLLRKLLALILCAALAPYLKPGLLERLIGRVAELHTDTTCSMRASERRGRSLSIESGVQQGCPLASSLFNVFFDHVDREALEARPGTGVTVQRRSRMKERLDQIATVNPNWANPAVGKEGQTFWSPLVESPAG